MHSLLVHEHDAGRLEVLPAYVALERLLSRVLPLVHLQRLLGLELLLAVTALELGLKVLRHVRLEGVALSTRELAVLALLRVVFLIVVGLHLGPVGKDF